MGEDTIVTSSNTAAPAPDVVAVRRQLAGARTIEHAMLALSFADLATLREIERGYHSGPPVPAAEVREWIARTHADLVVSARKGAAVLNTQKVSAAHLLGWALDTLTEWLPGITDWHDEAGGQYRITQLEDHSELGLVFEVSTLERHDPRRFRVTVAVAEELLDEVA